jgi:alpha-2-macroglobulin
VERRWYHPDGTPRGMDPLRVGDRVLVRVRVASGIPVEHALVVDLLPGGLELENANLALGEVAQDLRVEEGAVADLHASTRHLEYREDRFVAALAVGPGQGAELFYLARAVTPGRYRVPPPFVEDMYRPAIRALGRTPDALEVVP